MDLQLFSWENLSTLTGASVLLYLIVQYTKNLKFLKNTPTDIYSSFLGSIILGVAQIAQGADPKDWRIWLLALANGFIVSIISGKLNDSALKYSSNKIE